MLFINSQCGQLMCDSGCSVAARLSVYLFLDSCGYFAALICHGGARGGISMHTASGEKTPHVTVRVLIDMCCLEHTPNI